MMEPTKYILQSAGSGREYSDDGWTLGVDEKQPALLRSVYAARQLTDRGKEKGLFRYADWLPVVRCVSGSSFPVTYKSDALAGYLGLKNLWVTFSGYWPERGALMSTCSFKETEAYSVVGRIRPDEKRVLVVASAGNTARAFARVCSDNDINVVLCVPEDNIESLWYDKPIAPCVKLVVTEKGSDYADAIELADMICQIDDGRCFMPEGGARNIARRDGMGTTVLSAVTTMGEIPDVYIQAVGSGTGAIAAWEANSRLIGDGRYGSTTMKLVVAQNEPFTPICESWGKGQRNLVEIDADKARVSEKQILAPVLANRKPPYSLAGGLFDALVATNGEAVSVTNDEALHAAGLFLEKEGIDICGAASVAVASLIKVIDKGIVGRDETIMLNITGGGEMRYRAEHATKLMEPDRVVRAGMGREEIEKMVKTLFS